MAGVEPGPDPLPDGKENNSLLMCYDRKAVDKIIANVTDCFDKHIEDTIYTSDDIKEKIRTRFVEIYKSVLNQNIQISEDVGTEISSQSSSQSGGSVVNEKKEKYFNDVLMPELNRLLLSVVGCRKSMPPECVKQLAKQCSHECNTEAKRVVHLEPKPPLMTPEDGTDIPEEFNDRAVNSCRAISGLSMAFPEAIENINNLEKVLEMQSLIGNSKVDRIVFNNHQEAENSDQSPDTNRGDSTKRSRDEEWCSREEVKFQKVKRGFIIRT